MLPTGVDEQLDVSYGDRGADTTFDVFSPAGTDGTPATFVWIHGGAWISGSKEDVNPYARITAFHGDTTVSLNCTVAPEAVYPQALTGLNSALGFVVEHAATVAAARAARRGDPQLRDLRRERRS